MLMRQPLRILKLGTFMFLLLAAGWWLVQSTLPVAASQLHQAPAPTANPKLSISDDTCLGCHGQPGATYTLPSGEILDIYVSAEDYTTSVHGYKGYACVQCHTNVGEYPHPRFFAEDLRAVTLELSRTCKNCHIQQYAQAGDSVHAAAQRQGQREAATCVDCHGAHNVRMLNDPDTHELTPESRQWVPETCARCHSAIYEKYRTSVHGSALTENNPDVPTCIDCHGVHDIEDPRTAAFRLESPELCAKCHTDEQRMAKYGISTYVLNSYVSDFHGTTVVLFEKRSPDAETNKAVCYDCHGIHDIQSTRDENAGISIQTNLLQRCQLCHPDATANFPTAWLSHYEPSPEKFPLVYYVNLFYTFFIPAVLGGMAVLVALDAYKSFQVRMRAASRAAESHPQAVPAQEQVPMETAPAPEQEPVPSEPSEPPNQEELSPDSPPSKTTGENEEAKDE